MTVRLALPILSPLAVKSDSECWNYPLREQPGKAARLKEVGIIFFNLRDLTLGFHILLKCPHFYFCLLLNALLIKDRKFTVDPKMEELDWVPNALLWNAFIWKPFTLI